MHGVTMADETTGSGARHQAVAPGFARSTAAAARAAVGVGRGGPYRDGSRGEPGGG